MECNNDLFFHWRFFSLSSFRSSFLWSHIHTGGNKISFYSFRNEEPRPYPRRNPKGKPMRQMSSSQRPLINTTQPTSCFDISRDSQLAAIASGRSIQVWQINTPQMQQTFDDHTGAVTCVSFSPNCEFFASGAEDKTVIVWNMVFGLVVTTFKVCFSFCQRHFFFRCDTFWKYDYILNLGTPDVWVHDSPIFKLVS